MAIRVVVADDQEAVLQALVDVLAGDPEIQVVGTARDVPGALRVCNETLPDVALLDVRMPGGGGGAVAGGLRSHGLATRVVAISAYDDGATRERMADAGAIAYLLKDAPILDVLAAVRDAAGFTDAAAGSTP